MRDPEQRILDEFKFKSVIGKWGIKKCYIVNDVVFDKTPITQHFKDSAGNKMSVAEYFLKTYQMKISDKSQPLFLVKINGKECHLPSEFCTIDGVPESIREDPF